MKEFCIYCGAELREGARFCAKCGKPVAQPAAAQTQQPVAPPVQQPTAPQAQRPAAVREKGATLEKMRSVTERFIIRGITLLTCLIVFICGFFINIGFMPMEQVQSKVTLDISSGTADLQGMMSTVSFDQNIFNVFGALTVPLGGNAEEEQAIVDALTARVTDVVKKYESEITRLSAQVEAGNSRAAEQLVDLIERIVRDAARSVGGINLIKLDRLEAEQAFLNSSQTEGTTLFENAAKQANDSIARTAIMAGYPVGVIYLQVVSLVALITTAIGMFASSKKFSGSKFFTLYLAGFVFLFLIAQFTATSVGGTGIFCFVFASVMLLLYMAGKIFTMRGMTAEKIISVSAGGLATVLSFSALCILFGASFEFGGLVDKVGSVFGLHAFDGTSLVEGEGSLITVTNFVTYGLIYLSSLVFSSLVFFMSLSRLKKGERGKVSDIVITAIAAAELIISYIAVYIVTEAYASELLIVPAAFIASGLLLLCTLAVWIVSGPIGKILAEGKPAAPASPAGYGQGYNYNIPRSAPYAAYQPAAPEQPAAAEQPATAEQPAAAEQPATAEQQTDSGDAGDEKEGIPADKE